MWRRFQGHGREKEKRIGSPVLVETTYDEDHLRQIPTVSDAQDNFKAQSPTTPTRPYNTTAPNFARDDRVSDVPTVSSFYSQPSPERRYNDNPTGPSLHDTRDVSPPSSPEPEEDHRPDRPRRFKSMRDVSPIDENRAQRTVHPVSNIPVLRKAPPKLRDAEGPQSTQKFWGGKVAPNSKVRWDEYSGEPTSSSAGKAGSVSPGSYVPTTTRSLPMGNHVSVSGPTDKSPKATTLSERATRSGTKPSPVDTITRPREPWKGASGRAEIVQPFKDQRAKQKQPLSTFQRKPEPKKVEGSPSPQNAGSSVAATVKRVPVEADTNPVAEDREDEAFDLRKSDSIKPVVPLKVGRNSPPRSLASPTSPHGPQNSNPYSYPSPLTPTNHDPISSKVNEDTSVELHSTPSNTEAVRKSIESAPGSSSSKDNGPVSRFSWTTYNTNTTYQHSPPPSPPPPLPVATLSEQNSISAAASILNRQRPIPAADKVPARKPITATTARPRTMISDPSSPSPSSTFSTNTQKALPRPPTERIATDHVDTLEAQMDDLRLRRSNVNRLLQDLNNMAPPNPLITDFKRTRLVERRKKEFEDELAEIRREEHDVGLKLHRAYRKRENADPNGGGSAIWVRRVTRFD